MTVLIVDRSSLFIAPLSPVVSFPLSFTIKRTPMLVDAYALTTGGGFYSEVSCLRPGYDDIPPAWPMA